MTNAIDYLDEQRASLLNALHTEHGLPDTVNYKGKDMIMEDALRNPEILKQFQEQYKDNPNASNLLKAYAGATAHVDELRRDAGAAEGVGGQRVVEPLLRRNAEGSSVEQREQSGPLPRPPGP